MEDAGGEQAGDPCHSYTWSILFCIVMTLALLAWAVALALVHHHHHHHHHHFPPKHRISQHHDHHQVYRAQRRSCSSAGWVERASVILAVASLAQVFSENDHEADGYYDNDYNHDDNGDKDDNHHDDNDNDFSVWSNARLLPPLRPQRLLLLPGHHQPQQH